MRQRYALILTNSDDATADFLCSRLLESGVSYLRYDTDTCLSQTLFHYQCGKPHVRWLDHTITPDLISTLIYRRPKPFQIPINAELSTLNHLADEWSEAWEGFLAHCPPERWINHPARNFIAGHKIEQLSRSQQKGLKTPDTLVTNDPSQAKCFIKKCVAGVIAKPLSSGYIKRMTKAGDSLIYTSQINEEHLSFIDKISICPVMFQERVIKEDDVRVIVVDNDMHAVSMTAKDADGIQRLDIRSNNMHDVRYRIIEMPEEVKYAVRALLDSYQLRFAALDFAIAADGQWIFFEINPNGQWAWLDLEAGTSIGASFTKAITRDCTGR